MIVIFRIGTQKSNMYWFTKFYNQWKIFTSDPFSQSLGLYVNSLIITNNFLSNIGGKTVNQAFLFTLDCSISLLRTSASTGVPNPRAAAHLEPSHASARTHAAPLARAVWLTALARCLWGTIPSHTPPPPPVRKARKTEDHWGSRCQTCQAITLKATQIYSVCLK